MARVASVLVGCLLAASVSAAPRDDLNSSSQQVRDAAAALLRTSYVPPPRSRWEAVLAALQPGSSRDLVLQILQPYAITKAGAMAGGGSTTELYRLDDLWVLRCDYGRSGELFASKLIEQMRYVWVTPAADFTGVWITYYVNGQRSHEIQYRKGQHFGTITTFHSNGSKAVVQHHGAEGAEGEDIGYFRSGAVAYRGQYSKNEQVGTWVWYNEDGSVQSTQEH
jgi:hypothetical protein